MNAHETTDAEIRELSEIELDQVSGGAGAVARVQFAILDNHAS